MLRTFTLKARLIGWTLIAAIWFVGAYLIVYYSVLAYFGPDRLHGLLGDGAYNAIIGMGGITLLLYALILVVVWGAPFAIFRFSAATFLRLVWPSGPRRGLLRTATVVSLLATASLPLVLLDGWPDPLWVLGFGDDTEFAAGYSAWGFLRLKDGMTVDQVLAQVGPPLQRYPIYGHPEEVGWRWTRSPHDSSYRMRGAVFKNGRLSEHFSEFYVA
jgi:hypothetical protein